MSCCEISSLLRVLKNKRICFMALWEIIKCFKIISDFFFIILMNKTNKKNNTQNHKTSTTKTPSKAKQTTTKHLPTSFPHSSFPLSVSPQQDYNSLESIFLTESSLTMLDKCHVPWLSQSCNENRPIASYTLLIASYLLLRIICAV